MKKELLYAEIGRRIRHARERRGLTQEALASVVSLTRTSITNIERGRQTLLVHKFVEICEALQVLPVSLLPVTTESTEPDIQSKLTEDLSGSEAAWITTLVRTASK